MLNKQTTYDSKRTTLLWYNSYYNSYFICVKELVVISCTILTKDSSK